MFLSPSPAFSRPSPYGNYDVFLSFRGKDTRNNFTANLYGALRYNKIYTFMDVSLLGNEIKALFDKIKISKVAVVVYSENFASSDWCLRELEFILQQVQDKKMLIMPVFYKVDVNELKFLNGKTGAHLKKHVATHDKSVMKNWKDAVTGLGRISGLSFKDTHNRFEYDFIEELIAKTKGKLEDWEEMLGTKPKNDVFISVTGKDMPNNLVNLLYRSLNKKDIKTFMHYDTTGQDLMKDDDSNFKVIQRSKLAVVVFSKNYASSKRCLRELVEIIHCKDTAGLVVLPIFYEVIQSHLIIQPKGSLKRAKMNGSSLIASQLEQHLRDYEKWDTVQCWRNAVSSLGYMVGWHFSPVQRKITLPEFIKRRVDYISTKLNSLDEEKKESMRNQQALALAKQEKKDKPLSPDPDQEWFEKIAVIMILSLWGVAVLIMWVAPMLNSKHIMT